MKHFNIEIQITGETATAAIYDRGANLNDAVIANHTALASMRTSVDEGTLDSCAGLVINEKGEVEVKPEYYSKEA